MAEEAKKARVTADVEAHDGDQLKTGSDLINASGHVQELERNFVSPGCRAAFYNH